MHNIQIQRIQDHSEVFGADGVHVGVVDHLEGDRIKLTKSNPMAEGAHHFVPIDWIDHADSKIHLTKESGELAALWKHV